MTKSRGGREGGREGEREEGRKEGREEGRERGRKGGRKGRTTALLRGTDFIEENAEALIAEVVR